MKRVIIFWFLVIIIASCKKSSDDGYYTINGVVLDWDSKAPIAGAKVYSGRAFIVLRTLIDSAISDVNGRVTFQYKTEDGFVYLSASKIGYLEPIYILLYPRNVVSRTDTVYLARTSTLSVNLHKAATYLTSDSLHLKLISYYGFNSISPLFPGASAYYELKRAANAADTTITVPTIYYPSPLQKAYLYWDIIRNGNILSSNSDSTELVQFNTKSYTLNY